jgi:hypothetical protein
MSISTRIRKLIGDKWSVENDRKTNINLLVEKCEEQERMLECYRQQQRFIDDLKRGIECHEQ